MEPRDTHCLPENDWSDENWQVIIRFWSCRRLVNVNIVSILARWKEMSVIVNGVSHIHLPKGRCCFHGCCCSQFSLHFTAIKKKERSQQKGWFYPGVKQEHVLLIYFLLSWLEPKASRNAGVSQRRHPTSEKSPVLWALDQNFRIEVTGTRWSESSQDHQALGQAAPPSLSNDNWKYSSQRTLLSTSPWTMGCTE